ncbi:conserved hypothetical protein [Hyella patelloides LEGE 07179]|uniref:Uncharacterized protein n=1 Tax=Hyella patelloides LEGE 07179 TaxID=945734 RepID=A0A563VYX5_9CYAN|nr:hypothetical protein [Hyella patelloides]VEP16577.1 conserved hypothetical protein [Hyella patelloides LEGE 07179]
MNDDTPVSCDLNDLLEKIVTLKRQCTITYRNEKDEFTKVGGRIIDIYAAEGSDWCRLSDETVIRLDKIEEFESE